MIGTVSSSLRYKSVTKGMSSKTLKHITVDERNYLILKRVGSAGDSFNDVITKLLKTAVITEKEMKEVSWTPSTVSSPEERKKVVHPHDTRKE
jgi:predicted CopG family antitoxin